MNELCEMEGLPRPTYIVEGSDFWITFKKDIYNAEYLETLGLSDKQVKAVLFAKEKRKITNSDYQSLNNVSKATATRDLAELINKQIIFLQGRGKRDTHYTLSQKETL
jgi:ATP-dependent DNA helicase RecG